MVTVDWDTAVPPEQIAPAQVARPLPDELVIAILEFLGLDDLRAAAAVDRQFYQSAWRAGLYIERSYSYNCAKDMDSEAQTWTELVDHALRKDLQLALGFTYLWFNGSAEEHSTITRIYQSITLSLPVLVALSVSVPPRMLKDVYIALQHPAPILRSLHLSLSTQGSGEGNIIPNGLLSGKAPRLCELALGCLIDNTRAIPAFANVVRLVTYLLIEGHPISLGVHFPRLAHLCVYSYAVTPDVPPTNLDLSGIALRTLVFRDTRGYALANPQRKSLGDRHVPIVHHLLHQPKNMDWHCPLGWVDGGGTIHARLNVVDLGLTVFIEPTDLLWCRSYTFKICDLGSPLPLCNMPGICARLACIRVHSDAAIAFLQCSAIFSALARVRIDIAPAHASPVPLFRRIAREQLEREAVPRVRCPVLAIVAVAAQSRSTLTVDFGDVAFLCRALGSAEPPALELSGVFIQCSRSEVLDNLFSRVSCLPNGDAMPCAQFDSGVWDDHAAIMSGNYDRQSLAR